MSGERRGWAGPAADATHLSRNNNSDAEEMSGGEKGRKETRDGRIERASECVCVCVRVCVCVSEKQRMG